MPDMILKETEEKMQKTILATKEKFTSIRAGRASVSMLDGINVVAYGVPSPLKNVATVSAPEARLLTITPFDKTMIKSIEKAILEANLGFTPGNDGKIIRIQIPELTSDRRKEYVKIAKKEAEQGKVIVRNLRKDYNNKFRKLQKDSEITEDDLKAYEKQTQNLTDKYVKEIEELYSRKEKEILKG